MYEQIVKQQRRQIARLTLEQQKRILDLYDSAIEGLAFKAKKAGEKSLQRRWALDYKKEVEKAKKALNREINRQAKGAIGTAAKIGTQGEQQALDEIFKKAGLKTRVTFKRMFSQVQENVINDIISGNLYKDNMTLSSRIWEYGEVFGKDIQYVVNQAILEKKSAIELAKDLEVFVKDKAKRGSDWGKCYPNLRNKEVDYNAMRLARTSINHSYQTATVQSSNVNPFVDGIEWRSALVHGRTCELCEQRHGQIFPKNDVPLDHPNGLCTMVPAVSKSLDKIADELNRWIDGEVSPKLDEWYKEYGGYFTGLKEGESHKKIAMIQSQLDTLEQEITKFDIDKKYKNIWKDDVTLKEYEFRKATIEAKRKYYIEGTLEALKIGDYDKVDKFKILQDLLDEYERLGEEYLLKTKEVADLKKELEILIYGKPIDNPYSQERKDAAYWFKDTHKADDVLRPKAGEVWKGFTAKEKEAAYRYTAGSGMFNRPLRGYDGDWYNFKGIGKVPLNNEGGEEWIKLLTKALSKSKYDFDIWLNRGIETLRGLSGFLGVDEDELRNKSEAELEKELLGKVVKDEAFTSTGGVKGKGFRGHIINLYAPKGTEMMYVEPFSCYGEGTQSTSWDGEEKQSSFGFEFEVLLNRGYTFKITKVEKTMGTFYIDVDVLTR